MGSCLVELIAPGVGGLMVAVLDLICTIVNEMEESSELCKHVYERLAFIYGKLLAVEEKHTLPGDEILQKYSKLIREYKTILAKHRGKPWFYRVVTYKRLMQKIGDFQEGICTLMLALHLCNIEAIADERVQMERFRNQQRRAIESRLIDDAMIAREVVREVQQVEALSVFRYELQKPDLSEPVDQKVLVTALDKVMQRLVVRVLSVPE